MTLPPLRTLYQALSREAAGEPADAVLMAQLDEIVDATNTVSELVGLDPVLNPRPVVGSAL